MENEAATPLEEPPGTGTVSVFSSVRQVDQPPLALPTDLAFGCRLQMGGRNIPVPLTAGIVLDMFLGPQYRSAES